MQKTFLLDVLFVLKTCSFHQLINHLHQLETFFVLPSWNEERIAILLHELVVEGWISFKFEDD